MRASEAQAADPVALAEARWLLIGNSRWHWAAPPLAAGGPLRFWHARPREGALVPDPNRLLGWAAVGPVPDSAGLPDAARLQLGEVPLEGAPAWLGIDRALAGWWGWRLLAAPVLVADAGTVLSLTRVDGEGRFGGGRLLAGAALQLRAMAGGTAQLPALAAAVDADVAAPPWPDDTAAAMRSGVLRGLAAAITAAALEAKRSEPACRLLLTGGDGTVLAPLVDPALGAEQRPSLCLEALAALRPALDQPGLDQPSPRSLRI